jgi:Transposase DDE domain
MDGFEREALNRLPLAEAVLQLWGAVAHPETLQDIYARNRGRTFERELSFETIVHLIAAALLEHEGSGHKAMRRAEDDGELTTSIQAIYAKLARLPISLSCGFLLTGTQRLTEVLPITAAEAPPSLRELKRIIIDGKKLKHLPKRLKVARGAKGAVLGGKTAVALSMETGLAIAMSADLDGEVSDAPLMPELLSQLRASAPGPRLFVVDRQFCDLVQPAQLTADGDHYLIRYNAKVSFHVDPDRPSQGGRDERGREYVEEWGWLGVPSNPRRCYTRRITLRRVGEEDVILVTDLLDAEQYPAVDLLATYLGRWDIEAVFQKITEVFHLKRLVSSSPEGTIFQCAFCLLLYNMIVVLRGYVGAAAGVLAAEVSAESLFYDVHRQLIAWTELVGPSKTAATLGLAESAPTLRELLKGLLANVWVERWRKAPAKKHQAPPNGEKFPGGHTSLQRLRLEAKSGQTKPTSKNAGAGKKDL